MSRRMCYQQRGFLTIDVAIAIAIVAVLTVFVLMHGEKLWHGIRGKNVVEALLDAKNTIAVRFSALPDLSQLSVETAVAMSIFPKSWVSDKKIMDPWGGAVEVSGEGQEGHITLSAVPQDACVTISSSLPGNFRDVQVNGSSVMTEGGEPDITKIAGACTDGSANTVSFVFSKS